MTQSLTYSEAERELRSLLPELPFPQRPINNSDVVDEATLARIAHILQSCQATSQWQRRPRIYTILRMIGLSGDDPISTTFVQEDVFDVCIPFSQSNLPEAVKNDTLKCNRFLELQILVLTKPSIMQFSPRHCDRHYYTRDGDYEFSHITQLGEGGSAIVDHVCDRSAGADFARKRIRRGNNPIERKVKLKEFETEIGALHKVRHHHLVSCLGSYTDRVHYTIILAPVADVDLRTVLRNENGNGQNEGKRNGSVAMSRSTSGGAYSSVQPASFCFDGLNLRAFFGCLAAAVGYLHGCQIRHKDIKPGNILIKANQVFICDFGIARDWAVRGHSTTSGQVPKMTQRYCAPEVRFEEDRNESSDIFSLGCVYLEMFTVLNGKTIDDLDQYLRSNDPDEDYTADNVTFWSKIPQAHQWLDEFPSTDENSVLQVMIKKMTDREPHGRPSAVSILDKLSESLPNYVGACCSEDAVLPLPSSPPFTASPRTNTFNIPPISASVHRPSVSSRRRPSSIQESRAESVSLVPSTSYQDDAAGSHLTLVNNSHGRALSQRDSLVSNEEPEWNGKNDEVLHFEKDLTHYEVSMGGETTKRSRDELGSTSFKIHLFRTKTTELWQATRRFVVTSFNDETRSTWYNSNWLPLMDFRLHVDNDTVRLAWSDCNHDRADESRDYRETHSRIFDPRKPNNRVALGFNSSSDARDFARSISSLDGFDRFSLRKSDRTPLFSREGIVSYTYGNGKDEERAILLGPEDFSREAASRLYFVPHEIDLRIANILATQSTPAHLEATVVPLLYATYVSDAVSLSKVDNRKGYFESTRLAKKKVGFAFSDSRALLSFLSKLTGWELVFFGTAAHVKEHKKLHLYADLGSADLMLWRKSHENQEVVAVNFRLHKDKELQNKWVTAYLPRTHIVDSVKEMELSLNLVGSTHGDSLQYQSMSAHQPKSKQERYDAILKKMQSASTKYKIGFDRAQDLQECRQVIDDNSQHFHYSLSPSTTLRSVSSGGSRRRSSGH